MDVDEALAVAHGERNGQWSTIAPVLAGEVESLRAAVARVRKLCAEPNSMGMSKRLAVKVDDILRALDG
jgi:hypothetical protein